MEDCQREMTLDEWMAKLPDFHRANQELATLRATIEAKDADLTAMTSRYSRAAADIASLEQELADRKDRIAELTMIRDMPMDVIDGLKAELADLQCPECGYDSMERQWVCEHCGCRATKEQS